MTGLSKSILLISIEFLFKFSTSGWIQIFKFLSHFGVMSFDWFLKNGPMTHIWFMTYAIYTSDDLKFYFWFSYTKILEIRPRKNFKFAFSLKCTGRIKFQLSIRIKRKISRRMVCIDIGSKVTLPTIRMKIMIA